MSRKELPYLCSIQPNHLDNIEPLELDEHGYKYILVLIDAFRDWTGNHHVGISNVRFHYFGRLSTHSLVHTDRSPIFPMVSSNNCYSCLGSSNGSSRYNL